MKLRKHSLLFAIIAAAAFGAFSAPASAAPAIEVKFGPEFSLNEINIMPGDAVKGDFTVTNLTGSVQNLAMNFNIGGEPPPGGNLADELLVQIKKPDGNFAVMPNGTNRQIMGELAGDPFRFDALSGPEGNAKIYELWITFNPSAGNEYQDQKITFDISAGIEITADTEDGGNGSSDGNGGGSNPAPPGLLSFAAPPGIPASAGQGEAISGQEGAGVQGEEIGAIAGEEECVPVAWWIFALMLIAYWVVMYFNLFYRMEKSENVRWFWEAVYTVLALVGWYYLDRCRTNVWFVYASLISGFIIYLAYLCFFRKKINRDENPDQFQLPLK